jgi:signal transduction histidine kinase
MAGRDVALAVALRDGAVLIVEPGRALRRQAVFYGLLVVNVLAGLVVLLLVWLSARAIAAPLQAIADRADRFALDLDTAPMQERGPREARAVAAAFNRLRGELRRLMAERLRMLAAIAHDLKTYLTRLRLRAALIADEAQRDAADRDVRLMSELIEDVLLVARGEERLPASGPVDLARLAAETVAARAGAGEAVTLEGSVGGGALVTGDETGLRRALENLIGNAVKYAGAGRVVLTAEGDGWSLAVVDQGPGLPDGFEAEAFDLFSRAEGSRSRETGGAGLGLSIARALVRQSGGDVSLTPTPGGGLTATIHLPA